MNKKTKLLIIILSAFGVLLTLVGLWFGVRYLLAWNESSKSTNLIDSYSYEESSVSSDAGVGMFAESRADVDSDTEEKVIKTGYVSVEVKDIPVAVGSVRSVVSKYGGKVLSESDSGEGKDRVVYMTLKVDEGKYLEAYDELKALDGKLVSSSSSEEDVTEEYVDLNARLENLERMESQLAEILKSADTVEDTLAVYSELSSVRGNIESLEGRIKYLEDRADFSTISLTISQSSTGISLDEDKWEPWGVVKEAASALVSFGKGLVNVLIWVVVFSPVVLIPVGIVLVLKKKGKR